MVLDALQPDSLLSSPTPNDLEMLDSTPTDERPSLPTSLSDFALFPSSSSAPPSPSTLMALDDGISPFFRRLRRSSLLAGNPITALDEAKANSPLAIAFTARSQRAQSYNSEKMTDDGSTEPPSATSSLLFETAPASSSSSAPATPPRASPSSPLNVDPLEPPPRLHARRISHPPKPARLLDLRTNETHSPIEFELKSEAQFQRLIASYSYNGFPPSKHLPRTPRAWSDRGRYPEEAGGDDDGPQGVESGSDEEEDINGTSSVHSVSMTPSGSGEDQAMTIDTNVGGAFMMDIDMPSSHSALNSPTHPAPQQWRQTPPPTCSTTRPNKRKFDERYDPYPSAAKRRAVSPALNTFHAHTHSHHSHSHSHSHHSHSHSHSHSHPHSYHIPRSGSSSHHPSASPISIPVPRTARSVTSSPVLHPASSPVLRPLSFPHSPILKGSSPTMRTIGRLPPLATLRGGGSDSERERNQKGVDGAGEAVGSLSIA